MAFAGTGKIWMNGKLVDWADAKIHVASHVIHYGSGVFEGTRCYDTKKGPAVLRLDSHVARLLASAKIYRMDSPYTQSQLEAAVLDTIRVNNFKACYIRPLMYRGYAALGVNPLPCPVDVAIMVWEWGAYLGADALEQGVDVCVSSWNRAAPNTFPAMSKTTGNYANAALIRMEAESNGYSEGIALDTNGQISEGSGQNLFVVRNNVIYTPPATASILPGITASSSRKRCCRASSSISPTRRSSSARPSKSRRSARSTRSRSATASADRSPRPSSRRSSTPSTASSPTSTAGSSTFTTASRAKRWAPAPGWAGRNTPGLLHYSPHSNG